MEQKYQFIINPAARSGKNLTTWHTLQEELQKHSVNFEQYISKSSYEITKWLRRFLRDPNEVKTQIVVLGGDGTLNIVINSVLQYQPNIMRPIAYIPAGSGNDFARAHGIEIDPLASLRRILRQTQDPQQLPFQADIGVYTDQRNSQTRYFVNNLGIGLDATVVSLTNHSSAKVWLNKLGLGTLSYGALLMKTLSQQDSFPINIKTAQGTERIGDAYLTTISNHPYFGGGVNIMPDADPYDGKIDMILVEKPQNQRQFLKLIKSVAKHNLMNQPGVHRYTVDRLELETERLENGQTDGEELGVHTYHFVFTTRQYDFWL